MDFIKISNAAVWMSYMNLLCILMVCLEDVEAGCGVGRVGKELLCGFGLDFA